MSDGVAAGDSTDDIPWLSPRGFAAYSAALRYSLANDAGGFLPATWVEARFHGSAATTELVARGLWRATTDGYQLTHDDLYDEVVEILLGR